MHAPACVLLLLAIAVPAAPHAGTARRSARATHSAAPRRPRALEEARALLQQVKHDPAKRRYRHNWERAIAKLEKAARGRETAPALLDAARARYALYRFSQVESDRDAALSLARRATRAGSREAESLARSIRKEMEGNAAQRSRPPTHVSVRVAAHAQPRPASSTAQRPSAAPATLAEPSPSQPASAAVPVASEDDPPLDSVLRKALAVGGAGAPNDAGTEQPARLLDVKSWSNHDYTRIVLYLSHAAGFTRREAAAGDRPRQLGIDLEPALVDRPLEHEVRDSLVQRIRATQRAPETVGVVLELEAREDVTVFALQDPPRLIIDVGSAAGRPARASPSVQSAQRDEHDAGGRAERRVIRRVIVDAGHGGADTGAIGPTHVQEKDVTLAMARRLARRLEARGFEVVLTRDDDRFVPLEERTAIANARHGDLFVSLHANAHPQRDRRGIETYVLNVTGDRYAARLAARENGALGDGPAEGPEVRRILVDLEAKASADASHRLAELVQRELSSGIRDRFGEVRDLGVRSALFYVLLGARMPAVLVETAFISNRVEERWLATSRFQDEVAVGVERAIERFASGEARIASAR